MRPWRIVCAGVVLIGAATMAGAATAESGTGLAFTVSPGAGPPGTLVHFEGIVPPDTLGFDTYVQPGFAYGLQGDGGNNCELILPMSDLTKTVTTGGHISGSFVVGALGGCFMSPVNVGPQRARPGVYEILLGCHACSPIGTFTITSEVLAPTGGASAPLAVVSLGLLALGLALVVLSHRFARRA